MQSVTISFVIDVKLFIKGISCLVVKVSQIYSEFIYTLLNDLIYYLVAIKVINKIKPNVLFL